MPAMIEARGLVKQYGAVRAVDGVDLTVQKGEIYGFLGPNGAGKTTTIKMILSLARPSAGTVRVDGKDVVREPKAAKASLTYLPENLSLYKTLTGRQTLEFFAELRGAPREEVAERLAQVGLQNDADRRVGDYSKGMTQRLGLAQALLGDPPLLVLDEPSSGLDPVGARQVREILRHLHSKGKTIFFSSHILSEVQEIADRVAIIQRGRLVAEDSVPNLRARLALKGAVRLHLAAPPPFGLADALRRVAGVEDVRVEGLTIEIVCDPAVRWRVSQAAEAQGASIRDLETKDASLEEVFVRITTPKGPAP